MAIGSIFLRAPGGTVCEVAGGWVGGQGEVDKAPKAEDPASQPVAPKTPDSTHYSSGTCGTMANMICKGKPNFRDCVDLLMREK